MKKFTMLLLALLSMCIGVQAEEVILTDTPISRSNDSDPYVFVLSDGGAELQAANAQVGQEVRFYVTIDSPGKWMNLYEGHWERTYIEPIDQGLLASKGYFSLKLTQEILDAAYNQWNWGGTFILFSDGVFTVTKVTLATPEVATELSLTRWNKWDEGINLTENTDGSLTIDFSDVDAWKGASKWLGGFDASDYEYLVFEIAGIEGATSTYTVQTYVGYAEGDAQTIQWDLNSSPHYIRIPLDAARKNAIQQVAFQNPNSGYVPFTVKAAYWMTKVDYAEMSGSWISKDNASGIVEADRPLYANFDNFDYMVLEFAPQTTEAASFSLQYGGNLFESPWWVNNDASETVSTDANLKTVFIPLPEVTFKELFFFGYAISGTSTLPTKVYCATKAYLLEQGYTEEQLQNHIYVAEGRFDLDISNDAGDGEEGFWGWNNFKYTASDQTINGDSFSGGVVWSIWKDSSSEYLQDHKNDYGYVVVEFAEPTQDYLMHLWGYTPSDATDTWIDKYCTTAVWKYKDVEDLMFIGFTKNEVTQEKIKCMYLATEDYLTDNGLMYMGQLQNQYDRSQSIYYMNSRLQPQVNTGSYNNLVWKPQDAESTLDWQFKYDPTNEFEPDEYDYLVVRFSRPTATRTAQIKVSSGSYSFVTDIASPDESLACVQKVVKIDDEGLWEQFFETENWIEHITLINPTEGERFNIGNVYLVNSRKYGSVPTDEYVPNPELIDFVELPLASWLPNNVQVTTTDEADVWGDTHQVLNVTANAQVVTTDGEVKEDDFEVGYGWAPNLWFSGIQTEDISMAYNNLDYLVVEFDKPTSSKIGVFMRAVTDWSKWGDQEVNAEVAPADNIAQPFCKTIFIPLPKREAFLTNDLVSVQLGIFLKTHSVTHIARTYVASTEYLLENGYSEDDIANSIYGEGEEVTIGSTGYATIFFPGAWDHYVPGGLKGYDYEYEYEINSGVPPVLNVAHEYVADEKVNGDYAAVLKADETIKLPYTFYFPKAETELQGSYERGQYACLYGTEEAGETPNWLGLTQVRYYKLSTKNGKNVGFYWGAPDGGPFENGAKKAFLILPNYEAWEAANGYVFDAEMNLVPDGATTGITSVDADNDADAPAYNLSGQRVGSSYRGVVIQNGKKTLRK